jgi:dTDP-4-amino-4,6-dideoxygalactose transaminase
LDVFISERQQVAAAYDEAFAGHPNLKIPSRSANSTHVFHQYTLQTCLTDVGAFRDHLASNSVPSMVYYPIPLHKQTAVRSEVSLPISEALANCVVSLPIGTDMEDDQIEHIIRSAMSFYTADVSMDM